MTIAEPVGHFQTASRFHAGWDILNTMPGLLAIFYIVSWWTKIWGKLRRWGGVGLFLLGILDSSPIPTLGSLDALNVVLSARHKDLWLYYAAMSVLGSLAGAYLTYRVGEKAGQAGLQRKFGAKRMQQFRRLFARGGVGAVFIPAVVPPPFPTTAFFLGAGALHFPLKKFLGAAAVGRALRYLAFAYAASHLSRKFVRQLRHPERHLGLSLGITAGIILLVVIVTFIWTRLQDSAAAPAEAAGVVPAEAQRQIP
jgi:membrane protein YqaA with SNARE-associated domain